MSGLCSFTLASPPLRSVQRVLTSTVSERAVSTLPLVFPVFSDGSLPCARAGDKAAAAAAARTVAPWVSVLLSADGWRIEEGALGAAAGNRSAALAAPALGPGEACLAPLPLLALG